MLHFMEQHAESMEERVRQRQIELGEEKKKVESLLCNILPKLVDVCFAVAVLILQFQKRVFLVVTNGDS